MDIAAIAAGSAKSVQGRMTLSENFDTFLRLLTTQLQNQDPLSPLDTNEFTQQLVAYSQVEQQINTNENLNALLSLTRSAAGANAVGYLGKTALTLGAATSLIDGTATWRYALPAGAATVRLSVLDAQGRAVFTTDGDVAAGDHDFVWDGSDDAGVALAPGTYELRVTARDADGKLLASGVAGVGVVREIDMSGDEPLVRVGTRDIPLSEILALRN